MTNGTHCPHCNQDIGVFCIIRAAWPNKIRCPHCKSLLAYDLAEEGFLIGVAVPLCIFLLMISVITVWLISGSLETLHFILGLVLWVGLWGAFELLNSLQWRRQNKLHTIQQSSPS